MQQNKYLRSIIGLMSITLWTLACTFTVDILPTATPVPPTFTSLPPTFTPIPVNTFLPPTPTPTLISIRLGSTSTLDGSRAPGSAPGCRRSRPAGSPGRRPGQPAAGQFDRDHVGQRRQQQRPAGAQHQAGRQAGSQAERHDDEGLRRGRGRGGWSKPRLGRPALPDRTPRPAGPAVLPKGSRRCEFIWVFPPMM